MTTHTKSNGWIGVDLDGTLAVYDGLMGTAHVGQPVPAMLARVKNWLAAGIDVRIFTARAGPQLSGEERTAALHAIESWCETYLGRRLPITATKDYQMVQLWDDRAVQVIPNTGEAVQNLLPGVRAEDYI